MTVRDPILPGATLGVLGAGQLGRMFAIAARRMGYHVAVLSPGDDTPTGQVADIEINADYRDLDAVAEFARKVDVLTFEFENVPAETTCTAEKYAPVLPDGGILHTVQNRLREKSFLSKAGIPCAPYAKISHESDLQTAREQVAAPAVLKTASWGYDGKGQILITGHEYLEPAWEQLKRTECVLEQFITFRREVSVVVARDEWGNCEFYGPIENDHRNHILDVSTYPAPGKPGGPTGGPPSRELARCVAEQLGVVGVVCIEMFETNQGDLLINEIAPRPHNSGHLTIDSCITCQFEQQVRAICGLPLGSSRQVTPAAMANLLGDLWTNEDGQLHEPAWHQAMAFPQVKLHLYGKRQALPGRKMGHLTALATTPEEARDMAIAARRSLEP